MDHEADLVALLRLRPCFLRLRREFPRPYSSSLQQDAVLRHIGVEPGALRRDEGFAVDGEAIVLVALSEQVLLPDDAKGRPFGLAEFGVLGEEARLFERLGDLPPIGASPFFGFSFFHTAAWSSREAEAMVRSSCSFGMSPAPI